MIMTDLTPYNLELPERYKSVVFRHSLHKHPEPLAACHPLPQTFKTPQGAHSSAAGWVRDFLLC